MKTHTKRNERIVREVIKNFGVTLDLKQSPLVLIEILRKYGGQFALPNDGGAPPGGVGVGVGGPIAADPISNADLLQEILKVAREINGIRKQLK